MRSVLLSLLTATAAAQTCTPNATQQAASRMLALRTQLTAASVPSGSSDVPPALRPLLHNFKQALADAADTAIRCNNPEPSQLQSNLNSLLKAKKWPIGAVAPTPGTTPPSDQDKGTYGEYLEATVAPVPHQPDLYTVALSYAIECGSDNILLVYRRGAQGYQRLLAWQNPDLNSIGDAMGDVFLFTPVAAPVPAFAVVYGTPWCSSNESELRVDLVALASPSVPQHRLDHVEHDYRRDADVHLSSRPDGLNLHLSSNSVSGDLVFAPAVLSYTTATGRFVQQPVAPNARAFVDLWLTSDWKTVAPWAAGDANHFKALHDDMTGAGANFVNFGPTLSCGGNHYQVELDLEADHTTADLQIIALPNKYAQIRTNAASFTLLDITDKADPSCHGPDLMQRKK